MTKNATGVKGIVICVCCGHKEEVVLTNKMPECSKCCGPALLDRITVTRE